MSHTNNFDKTIPVDTERMGLGTQRMRDLKSDTQERMEQDHYWGVETDTTDAGADGYHKKARLSNIATPTAMANAVILYGKNATTKCDLHLVDSSSNDLRLTEDGNFRIVGDSIDYSTCFFARRASDFTITTTPARVPFNSEFFDSYADHNSTTGTFIAPATGIYRIFLRALIFPTPTPSGNYEWYYDATVNIKKNGTTIHSVGFNAKARFVTYHAGMPSPTFTNYSAESLSFSKMLNLSAADTIEIYAEGSSWWLDYTRNWIYYTSDSYPHIHGYGDCAVKYGSMFVVSRLF